MSPASVAIIGSRSFLDEAAVRAVVRALPAGITVISGGAPGPDAWAVDEARAMGLRTEVVRPDLAGAAGRGAITGRYYARNRAMVDRCQRVIAFLAGERGGAVYTAAYAEAKGVPVEVHR